MAKLDIYQKALLSHHQQPYGFELAFDASHQACAVNAFCGDEITIKLQINQEGLINHLGFYDDSCAICRASASILCQLLIKSEVNEAENLSQEVIKKLINKEELIDDLLPLNGIKKYPVRLQCALLPWQTFNSALKQKGSM